MKRSILSSLIAMAFATAGFAQNIATLNQVGSNQTSQQTQSGNGLKSTVTQGSGTDATVNTRNQSQTDQIGRNHTATVTQDGNADYNQAVVTQTGGGSTVNTTEGNRATISQQTNSGGTSLRSTNFGTGTAGTGNYANVVQQSVTNAASVEQNTTSSGNFGRIEQTGSRNSNAGGAPGGDSFIKQNNTSTGNAAQVTQPGNQNGAQVSQGTESSQNQATVEQVSDGNFGEIKQNLRSSLNTANLNQSGGASQATISQETDAAENQARLIQIGNGNVGTIQQQAFSGGTGVGNKADLLQQGDNNTQTSIIQNNTSYSNTAYLNQYGNNNRETRITQSDNSHDNKARIDQGGDGKGQFPARPDGGDQFGTYTPVNNGKAIIEQSTSSHDNVARIGQSGNDHDAQIYQNGSVTFSEAFIDQFPAASGNNTGLIKQTNSTLSSARITQNQETFPGALGTGNNIAEVYQGSASYGPSSGNITTVIQENGSNQSYNEQFGANNLMDIRQYGNGNVVTGPAGVYRSAGIAHQEGMTNKAYITQTANGGVTNVASLYQNGSNNTATITQNGTPTP